MSFTSLDEIVFENRNKEYGAYKLRATYVKNVLIGLLFTFVITACFCSYFVYYNFVAVEDYSFSPEMLKFADYKIDEELLKATELEPLKDKIKEIPQPKIDSKPMEVSTSTQIVNTVKLKDEIKIIDSVAIKDSIEKVKQAEIEKTIIDTLPKFAGKTDAFRNYLVTQIPYPDTSYIRTMKGKLMISFIINQNGETENITLDNFADTRWGKLIVLAVKASPRWQPAYRKGKPVKMQYTIPVFFAQ
jgi:periplasmic protein TonB